MPKGSAFKGVILEVSDNLPAGDLFKPCGEDTRKGVATDCFAAGAAPSAQTAPPKKGRHECGHEGDPRRRRALLTQGGGCRYRQA